MNYDVTLIGDETVKQFEDKVKQYCNNVSKFKLLQNENLMADTKIEDVLKGKFQIEVN